MSSLHYAEEDRKADADTHLAAARSQNTGTGILGIVQKIKDSRTAAVFFVIYDSGEGKQFLNVLPKGIDTDAIALYAPSMAQAGLSSASVPTNCWDCQNIKML